MSDSEHDSDDENIDGSSSEDSVNQSGDDSSTDSSIEEPTVMQSDSGKDASSADDQTASMGAFGHIPNLQSRLGDYVLTREIGRGGMGVVFEASEVSLRRQVALKILPVLAQDDGTYLQRFENESRAAAQLNHPDIVPVYGVGRQDGVCYFAMKLIEGRNLSQVIKSIRTELSTGINANSETPPLGKFPTAADNPNAAPATQKANIGPHHDPGSRTGSRVSLSAGQFSTNKTTHRIVMTKAVANVVAQVGVTVADALHHAHEAGIVHRDIKPANLLLDNEGKIWVTDFGLARVANSPSITQTGMPLGTLRYMSPEQASGRRAFVDHRTDIYSLGVTLMELLTLRPLISGTGTEVVLKQVTLGPPISVSKIVPGIPADLAVILEKSLQRDPADRYEDAGEMADDLNRFLHHQPIKAKRPGIVRRGRHWLARHRVVSTSLAIGLLCTFLTSVAASGLIYNALVETEQQKELVEAALGESEGLRLLAIGSLEQPDNPGLGLALALEGAKGAPGLEANNIVQKAADANHEIATHTYDKFIGESLNVSADGRFVVACESKTRFQRGSYSAVVHDTEDGTVKYQLDDGTCITSAAFSPSGRYVVTTSSPVEELAVKDGEELSLPPRIWLMSSGERLRTLANRSVHRFSNASFHPNQDLLLLCVGNDAVVHDISANKDTLRLSGHSGTVTAGEFSPDGKAILTFSQDGTLRVWDSETGAALRPPIQWKAPNSLRVHAAFTATSKKFAICDNDGIRLYSVVPGDQNSVAPEVVHRAYRMAVSRSGRVIVAYNNHSTAPVVVDSESLQMICSLAPTRDSEGRIADVTFGPSPATVLVARGRRLQLYDAETGELLSTLNGHTNLVTAAAITDDANTVVSTAADTTLRLWNARSGRQRRGFRSVDGTPWAATISAQARDGKSIAFASRRLYRTSLIRADGTRPPGIYDGLPSQNEFNANRLVITDQQLVRVVNPATENELYVGRFADQVSEDSHLVSGDRKLVIRTYSSEAFLVDIATNARLRLAADGESVSAVDITPDRNRVLLGTTNGRCVLVDAQSGKEIWSRQHDWPVVGLAVNKDATLFSLVDNNNTVVVESLAERGGDPVVIRSDTPINKVAFVAGGKLVVGWHSFRSVAVQCWDVLSGATAGTIDAEDRVDVCCHSVKPIIAIASPSGAVIWNPATDDSVELSSQSCTSIEVLEHEAALIVKHGGSDENSPLAARQSEFQIRSVEDGELLHQESLPLNGLGISSDLKHKVFAVSQVGYAADVFDATSGKHRFESSPHSDELIFAGFVARSGVLLTVSTAGTIHVTDEGQQRQVVTNDSNLKASAAAISPDGGVLVIGHADGAASVHRADDLSATGSLTGHKKPVRQIRFDSTGHFVVTTSPGDSVRHWDLRTSKSIEIPIEHPVYSDISADGRLVLVISKPPPSTQQAALIYNVDTKETTTVTQEEGTQFGRFFPTGKRIGLLAANGRVDVMDLTSHRIQKTLPPSASGSYRLAFSHDGKKALVDCGSELVVWDIDAENQILRIHEPNRHVLASILYREWEPFSPEGRWGVVCNRESSRFRMDPVTQAAQDAPRQLTPGERRRFRLDLGTVTSRP